MTSRTHEQRVTQAQQALGDVGDIAQDANNVTAKIALRLKNPELADEAKSVFERLLTLNAVLTYMLSHADTHSLEAELEEFNILTTSSLPGLDILKDLPARIMHGTSVDRRDVADIVRNLLRVLAYSAVDMSSLDVMANAPCLRAGSDPVSEETKHDVLLALVRCYRFMIEATPEMLTAKRTSRIKLLRQARALEMKAAISGIET